MAETLYVGGHIGAVVVDRLQVANGTPELGPLLGIFHVI